MSGRQGKTVVWGTGAVGGALGAAFIAAGREVLFVDQDRDHVAALNCRGLRLEGPVHQGVFPAEALLPDEVTGRYDTVFLAVKAHQTRAAVQQILPHLEAGGVIVSAQNGLNELTIAEMAGIRRTVGCLVNFGADYMEPGVIHYGGRGAVVIGAITSENTGRVQSSLYPLMLDFDDRAVLTDNIPGYLWSKLIYGAMLYATALTDAPIWQCLGRHEVQPVFIALGREIAAVAEAEGVKLESFDGFDPHAFSAHAGDQAAFASMDAMSEHNAKSEKTHSGIWRDLAVRSRRTEVDAQLGPITGFADKYGCRLPVLKRLITAVHRCEDGMPRQWENLHALAGRGN